MRNYPVWLGEAIIEDDLPWNKFKVIQINQFLDNYSLHDAEWVRLLIDNSNNNELLIIMSLDPHWLPNKSVTPSPYVKDWPLLFIKITDIITIHINQFDNSMNTARTISYAKSYENKKLVIVDILDGETEIDFNGDSSFLLLTPDKEVIGL